MLENQLLCVDRLDPCSNIWLTGSSYLPSVRQRLIYVKRTRTKIMKNHLKQLTIKRSLFLIGLFIGLQTILGLGFYFLSGMSGSANNAGTTNIDIEVATLGANLSAGLLILLLLSRDLRRFGKNFSAQIGLGAYSETLRKSLVVIVAAFLATRLLVLIYRVFILPYFGMSDVVGGGTKLFVYVQSTDSLLIMTAFLILALVIGPIVEEILFRGYLQSALMQRLPTWFAIALTSIGFMLIHGPPILWPTYFLHSVLWGWIYARTKLVKYAILFHMLSNTYYLVISLSGLDFLR